MWSVFFVFLSYLDKNVVKGDFLSRALDAERESKEMFSMLNGTFCAKMSTVRESFFYQVSDGAEAVRSVVSPAGKLMTCSVTVNQTLVKSFMHECKLGLKEQKASRQLDTRFARMDEAKRMCRELKERSGHSGRLKGERQDSALRDEVLSRSKRGFTYPGTLWCGAGNMADHYDQLGEFAETDSCCRIHDHCPHVIHAFSSNYGHTNFKWHSICHCDCDNTLKDCFRKVNDTSSRVMGQAFFNVLGVPCFEFAYEEQCAEWHWYGMCKRYEKSPIAVLKEAVPYDFGGIDVIDVLTVSPPKKQESKKEREEEEKLESTTQSSIASQEEPSLTNVVTAAEDFIKVLATVSSSQSSAADSDKGETQSSEKKKRKNTGKTKKTNKKKKGKGKGRKRKQKAEADAKVEDAAVVPTSGGKAEEVNALSNFISESHKHDQSSRTTNRVGDSEYELGGEEEPLNEVMKDEPAMNKETVSITSPTTVQKKPAESEALTGSTEATSTTTVTPLMTKSRRLRKGKGKIIPPTSSVELVMIPTDNSRATSAPTILTVTPTAQPEQHRDAEKRPGVSTARNPFVMPKVKRNRSKERGDREGRKKRRKASLAPPMVAVSHEISSVPNLEVITLRGLPVLTTERQVSHRLDINKGETSIQVKAPNSSFSVLKRQMSKERGFRRRWRKTSLPLSGDNPLFHKTYENLTPVLPTPEKSDALNSTATTAAISRRTRTHKQWRLHTTTAPFIIAKTVQAALSDVVSVANPIQQTITFTTITPSKVTTTEEFDLQRFEKPRMTTSGTPVMSPLQLSIERVKAQFLTKKRRKAALFLRQQ